MAYLLSNHEGVDNCTTLNVQLSLHQVAVLAEQFVHV